MPAVFALAALRGMGLRGAPAGALALVIAARASWPAVYAGIGAGPRAERARALLQRLGLSGRLQDGALFQRLLGVVGVAEVVGLVDDDEIVVAPVHVSEVDIARAAVVTV